MRIIEDLNCCRFNLSKHGVNHIYGYLCLNLEKDDELVIFKKCTINMFSCQNTPTITLVFIDCNVSYLDIECKINKLIINNSELMNISIKNANYLQLKNTIVHVLKTQFIKKLNLDCVMILNYNTIINSKKDKKTFYNNDYKRS